MEDAPAILPIDDGVASISRAPHDIGTLIVRP